MARSFAITFDYRCPFARNAHEFVLDGLAAGADWDVRFAPFSLAQAHVAEGEASVWDEPDKDSGGLALRAGIAVRDRWPEAFPAVHRALFAARHDHDQRIKDAEVVRKVLLDAGVDADEVLGRDEATGALGTVKDEHEAMVANHNVWGVPTLIVGDSAVFVRLMTRPQGDGDLAIRTIEQVLDQIDRFPELNEFKHTSIPR